MEVLRRSRAALWFIRRRTAFLLAGFIIILLILVLWPRMVFVIESGHAGVVYRTFWGGTVTRNVRDEGLQLIMPWNTLTIYDVRLQQVEQQFTVISNDGLEIHVVLSIRYAPKVELLGLLHKKIGPDYLRKIIIPDVHALIRTTFGQYSPEEIYRTKRSLIQETFQSALSNLGDKYVEMDDLLIKSIELPEMIRVAIENKHVEQQLMLQMRYRIDRERQEAERKEIEAGGVDRFQSIVSRSLTPQLLQYKGIEALAKLAESNNAKLVLAGGGTNGIPLILDTTTGAAQRDQAMLGFNQMGIGTANTPSLGGPVPRVTQNPLSLPKDGRFSWLLERKPSATSTWPTPTPTPEATPAGLPASSPEPSDRPTPSPTPRATPTVTPAPSPGQSRASSPHSFPTFASPTAASSPTP